MVCLDQQLFSVPNSPFSGKKVWAISGCFFQIRPVSMLTFRGHNLCCECPISKLKYAFSSCLVVLQYGVLRYAITFVAKTHNFLVIPVARFSPLSPLISGRGWHTSLRSRASNSRLWRCPRTWITSESSCTCITSY